MADDDSAFFYVALRVVLYTFKFARTLVYVLKIMLDSNAVTTKAGTTPLLFANKNWLYVACTDRPEKSDEAGRSLKMKRNSKIR
eukprot:CAMPEP_0196824510 /NCGR_PEP_ID=MMETSP1362-20130617/92159_1 /TAXON_ID=163516 /ORGANISM="Leptocylindrus danicus, Strain CCMP1856" /LENGTH=83 /DNA_ID=CAMNT_0042204795 /DNA_START=412 /DNA_END=663 /DNA_ORIENTATION=-